MLDVIGIFYRSLKKNTPVFVKTKAAGKNTASAVADRGQLTNFRSLDPQSFNLLGPKTPSRQFGLESIVHSHYLPVWIRQRGMITKHGQDHLY
jgi:hypothetical protein